jgi:ribose-phosphate pyrophosphokinase
MKLFTLNATRSFAEALAERLAVPLAAHEEREFEDREFKVRALESVRGEHVILCQSLCPGPAESINDRFIRLLVFIGALKDAGADRVTALVPYLAYARKDRRTKIRDPVTTRYVASLFEAVGADLIVTLEVHNLAAFENAFRRATIHLDAAPMFVEHFAGLGSGSRRCVVLSPDAGGVKRARDFANRLGEHAGRPVELAFMEKTRSEGKVSGDVFAGDVDGADVIIYDDLISGGTTIARAARACRARGAHSVHAAAAHGVFSAGAGETLGGAAIDSLVVSDSVGDPARHCGSFGSRIDIVSAVPLFADACRRITA